MRGVLTDDQFMIYKERNGKQGYLVFKGFLTTLYNTGSKEMISEDPESSGKRGIIVCMGWVPAKEKDENYEDYEPEKYDPVIEDEEGPKSIYDLGTGMTLSEEELSAEDDDYGQFYVNNIVEI